VAVRKERRGWTRAHVLVSSGSSRTCSRDSRPSSPPALMYLWAFILTFLLSMGFWCDTHGLTFGTRSAWATHRRRHHNLPDAPTEECRTETFAHLDGPSVSFYHVLYLASNIPVSIARPCTKEGAWLPHHTPPPPRDNTYGWTPFDDLWSFNFADHEFVKRQSSAADINLALDTWAARSVHMTGVDTAPFKNADDLKKTIDAIKFGEVSWGSFEAGHSNPSNDLSAPFERDRWTVHTRDMLEVVHNLLSNSEFRDHFDYTARREHVRSPDEPNTWQRRYSDVMSGDWAWQESVRARSSPIVIKL
jgi:hypothetical protein